MDKGSKSRGLEGKGAGGWPRLRKSKVQLKPCFHKKCKNRNRFSKKCLVQNLVLLWFFQTWKLCFISKNDIHLTAEALQVLMFSKLGLFGSAVFPNLLLTDSHNTFRQAVASKLTSSNCNFFSTCMSPLDGPSAILLCELTLEIQQRDFTWVSISARYAKSHLLIYWRVLKFTLYKWNFVSSLSR